MSEQTRRKIDALIAAGHSGTITGILALAVDRLYEDEMVRGNVRQISTKPGWQVFPDQN
jgi:hypothetical protein